MHLDTDNKLHGAASISLVCPQCQTKAHLTPSAAPQFAPLHVSKAEEAGMVYQCDNCKAPIFLRYRIRKIKDQRIKFDPKPMQQDTDDIPTDLSYVPEPIAASFQEAMACYNNNLLQAFSGMCRLTAEMLFDDLGEGGKLKIFDEFDQIARLTNLEEEITSNIRTILFDDTPESLYFPDGLDRATAVILIEVMKDLLHQTYARFARLRKALKMRQIFAGPVETNQEPRLGTNVEQLRRNRSTGTA